MTQITGNVTDSSISGWIANVVVNSTYLSNLYDVSTGGKQVNQVLTWKGTYWQAQDVSGTSTGASTQYVDGSLATRDAEIDQLDASIIRIDASILTIGGGGITADYVDGSIATAIDAVDTSLANYAEWLISSDTSIGSGSGGITADYVDGSIVTAVDAVDTSLVSYINPLTDQLDASVVRIDAYNIIQDTSIYNNLNEISQLDASVVRIDASILTMISSIAELNDIGDVNAGSPGVNQVLTWMGSNWQAQDVSAAGSGATYAYVDGSLAARDAEIDQLDASVVRIDAYNIIQDTSMTLRALTTDVDNYNIIQDTSMLLRALSSDVDSSLADAWVEINQLDASVIRIDASILTMGGGGATTLDELTDVSLSGFADEDIIQYNVDTSTWDTTSLVEASTYFVTKNYQMTDQTDAYIVQSTDGYNLIDASGTYSIYLDDSLDTGFQCGIVNSGVGTITLEASGGVLYTADASVKLSRQYAGATVAHKGSGVWYAWGLLE